MKEEFLQFYWKLKSKGRTFTGCSGESIEVVRPGNHNHDAGPDFLEALIRINGTLWAGHVEVHSMSSEWDRHHHSRDEAYSNVVLHVVYNQDREIRVRQGEKLVTLALEPYIGTEFYQAWQSMVNNDLWIPCAREIHRVAGPGTTAWLERLCAERMEMRAEELSKLSVSYTGDPAQLHYHSLLASFGFALNRGPAELLARQTPYLLVCKYRSDLPQLESLFFGQAGLLGRRYRDQYARMLCREYLFLKHKHCLKSIPGHLWKFLRLRPNNFPTIRLAQLAMFLHRHANPSESLAEAGSPREASQFFRVGVSEYWKDHYLFDKVSRSNAKVLNEGSADLLLLNHVIPWLFFEGARKNESGLKLKAMDWLEELKPESNSLTRKFQELGLNAGTAMETQGLLQLKKHYCDLKKCLDCGIGLELLGKGM